MSSGLVWMCTFQDKTLVLCIQSSDGFEHVRTSVIQRWSELGCSSFSLFYNLNGHPRCCLDNEEDFNNIFAVVQILGIMCATIDVVMLGPDLILAAGHRSEVGECSRAETNEGGSDMFSSFCVHERKQLMTVGWDTLLTGVGQVFEGGVKEVRMVLCKLRLHSGYNFKYLKNDRQRVHAECSKKGETGCPWFVYFSKASCNGFFYVRKFISCHTSTSFENSIRRPSCKVVASLFEDTLRDNETLSPTVVQKQLSTSFGLSCTYDVAWHAVNCAREAVFGKDEMSYANIREYFRCLVDTNPGSHVVLDVDEGSSRFRRIFVAFGAYIEGFNCCLPLIFLDGTHLKHRFKGHLLAANGRDDNSGMYTLCFAIVDSENDGKWLWFLENLKLCVDSSRTLTFVSDRNPGLIAGVPSVFPHCYHAYCLYHLELNLNERLNRAKYSRPLKERIVLLFKQCAYVPTVDLYNWKMRMLTTEGKSVALDFVASLSADKWANAHFKGKRYGFMTSSLAESFNKWILKERELHGSSLLDMIRLKMMQQKADRCLSSAEWTSDLCPEVDRTLNEFYNSCKSWNAVRSSANVFEVICQPSVKVDVLKHTCTCHRWQISGIPCQHALLCIKKYGLNVLLCVDPVFHAVTYRRCYSFPICPVPSLDLIKDMEIESVLPPMSRRMPGRPKKGRIKSRGETCARPITCGRCGKSGNHNRKTCAEPLG